MHNTRARNLIIIGLAAALVTAATAIITIRPAHADSRIVTCTVHGCSDWHRQDLSARRHPSARAVAIDANGNSVSIARLVHPLRVKVQQIFDACGARVVSAYRKNARTPRGHVSNHAVHRAADLRGNPRCIYAHLTEWPGGVTLDYARAPGGPHVHVSYNPKMEWGRRFVHAPPRKAIKHRSR